MRLGLALALVLVTTPLAALATGSGAAGTSGADLPDQKVIVGVPDTGINPYHEAFYRPGLTEHPSTYIEGYPADAEKLELSIETARQDGYDAALAADQDVWDSLDTNTLYWIPETSIVAALCLPEAQRGAVNSPGSSTCILDDGTDHGTRTAGAVATANPDALIAFKQGGSGLDPLVDRGVPMDVASVSWGNVVPFPRDIQNVPLYFTSAGNDPSPTVADPWAGHPRVIAVGGAYNERSLATSESSEPVAAKTPDIVSSYCLQLPHPTRADGTTRSCGTSFAAPIAAGGLSKAILAAREASGYTGQAASGFLDPELGLEISDVRAALNATATYDPPPSDTNPSTIGGPVVDQAPWVQWGWGFYNGEIAERTIEHLLGQQTYEKPEAAHLWMETVYDARGVWGDGSRSFAPSAAFTYTCSALTCAFDASDSQHPQDRDLEHRWAFGDSNTATGAQVEHTFDQAGTFDVTLTVDDGYRTDQATSTLTVYPSLDVDVATDQPVYGPREEVTVHLTVTAEEDGTPIEGATVDFAAEPATVTSFAFERLGTDDEMQAAGLYYHETSVQTDANGEASWTVPSDPEASPATLHGPTATGEMDVTATVDADGSHEGSTSSVVMPGPLAP